MRTGEVALRLGGAFQTLQESEDRHRALLTEAEALLTTAEGSLAAERSRAAALQAALERCSQCAAEAGAGARAAQAASAKLEASALADGVAAQALVAEVASLELADAAFAARAEVDAEALVLLDEALDDERARSAALDAALAERNAALEAAAAREAQLRRDIEEERQRAKRFAAARTEKEKQLAVALSEKNRLSALLGKKDALARDLSASLKAHEHQAAQKQAAALVQQERRRVVRKQAALAIGEAAAEQAVPPYDESEDARGAHTGHSSAHGACVDAASHIEMASRVVERAPGAQKRFDGWRNASGAQREAALRSENAVLIGVLAERDAALKAAHAEASKLRAEHAAMLTRWRQANKSQRRLHAAAAVLDDASKQHAAVASQAKERHTLFVEAHVPQPKLATGAQPAATALDAVASSAAPTSPSALVRPHRHPPLRESPA